MFSLVLLMGNFDLIIFRPHVWCPLEYGAPVRPNVFKHSLNVNRALDIRISRIYA